jgi:uncharacterized membrane protein
MIALLSLPSPLHPALVHFPVVLLLLGAAVAVAAAFTRRWQLPQTAAVLLALGAIGSVVAVQTGEHDGEIVSETPAIEAVLEQHEEWAERTQVASIVAALLAVVALFTTRWPVATRSLGIVTAVGALLVSWCVTQTGHYGGQLVYRHGAGVNLTAGGTGPAAGETTTKEKKPRKHDDD